MSAAACTGDRYCGQSARPYAGTPLGLTGASTPPAGVGQRQRGPVPARRGAQADQRARGRAGRRVGRERGGDQRQQLRRDAAELRPALDDPEEDGLEVARAVGRAAGGGVGHRGAPGVHVGRPAGRPALDDLGREIARGAHHQSGLGEPGGVGQVRDAEVDHDRLPVVEQHVARLEVAVHHPGRVDGGERLGQPARQLQQRPAAERAALPDRLVQRRAGHVPGHDVR